MIKKSKNYKVGILSLLILITIFAISLMAVNFASAIEAETSIETEETEDPAVSTEEPIAPSNEPLIFCGVRIVGLNGENPTSDDYTLNAIAGGGMALDLNTPNWILTGTADASSEKNWISIRSNKVYIKDLTMDVNALGINILAFADNCELTVLKCTQKSYSSISSLASANENFTINGEGMLHLNSGLLAESLTIDGVTLSVNAAPQYSNGSTSFAANIIGNFTMRTAKLIAENPMASGSAYGVHFGSKVTIDNASEVFIAGNSIAVDFNDETTLSNALGSEEFVSWHGDKSKVNKITTYKPQMSGFNYVKCIADTGEIAKTVYKAASAPPAPEPANPEYTTAQTGDDAAWLTLAFVFIALAGATTCTYIYRRKNN